MDRTVIRANSSLRDLRRSEQYLRKHEPVVMSHIRAEVRRIEANPYLSQLVESLESETIRETFAASYRIFFELNEVERRIEIVRVWHASREEPTFD